MLDLMPSYSGKKLRAALHGYGLMPRRLRCPRCGGKIANDDFDKDLGIFL